MRYVSCNGKNTVDILDFQNKRFQQKKNFWNINRTAKKQFLDSEIWSLLIRP